MSPSPALSPTPSSMVRDYVATLYDFDEVTEDIDIAPELAGLEKHVRASASAPVRLRKPAPGSQGRTRCGMETP